jgi:hypothetical protein
MELGKFNIVPENIYRLSVDGEQTDIFASADHFWVTESSSR